MAAGLWTGTTSTNQAVAGIILPNGTYYFIYSYPGSPTLIAGVTQGTVTTNGNVVTSNDGRDFNFFSGIRDGTASGVVTAKSSLVGAVQYNDDPATLGAVFANV